MFSLFLLLFPSSLPSARFSLLTLTFLLSPLSSYPFADYSDMSSSIVWDILLVIAFLAYFLLDATRFPFIMAGLVRNPFYSAPRDASSGSQSKNRRLLDVTVQWTLTACVLLYSLVHLRPADSVSPSLHTFSVLSFLLLLFLLLSFTFFAILSALIEAWGVTKTQ